MQLHIFLLIFFTFTLYSCCKTPEAPHYPEKPDFENLLTNSSREKLFGEFEYEPWWGKGEIKFTNEWDRKNIIKVFIPQLKGILSYNNKKHSGYTRIHKNVEIQYRML